VVAVQVKEFEMREAQPDDGVDNTEALSGVPVADVDLAAETEAPRMQQLLM